jgi:hypothetical protein
MKSCRSLLAVCLLGASAAHAQQMDMDAMMKWASADVIRYHIVGAYHARTYIASDGSGQADITDGLVIDLTWKLSESKLVGKPTFQNTRSIVKNVADREPKCLAPILRGDYEHYEVLGIKDGLAGSLELQVRTSYPVVEVVQFCTGGRKVVAAKTETRPAEFGVISPVMFGMPLPDSDDLRISSDKKSFIVRKAGWTWTMTPSIASRQ